jgi:hypothetical protein
MANIARQLTFVKKVTTIKVITVLKQGTNAVINVSISALKGYEYFIGLSNLILFIQALYIFLIFNLLNLKLWI